METLTVRVRNVKPNDFFTKDKNTVEWLQSNIGLVLKGTRPPESLNMIILENGMGVHIYDVSY